MDDYRLADLYRIGGNGLLLPVAHNVRVVRLAIYLVEHGAVGAYVGVLDEQAADLIQQHQRRALNGKAEDEREDDRQRDQHRLVEIPAAQHAQHRAGCDIPAGDEHRDDKQNNGPGLRYGAHEQGHRKRGAGDDEPYYKDDVQLKLVRTAGAAAGAGTDAGAAVTPPDGLFEDFGKVHRTPSLKLGISAGQSSVGLAVAAEDVDDLVSDHFLDGGAGGLQVLAGIEVGRMLGKVLADGGGHGQTQVGVDVDLADGAAGGLTELILGHADGAGHIAAVLVDHHRRTPGARRRRRAALSGSRAGSSQRPRAHRSGAAAWCRA